MSDTLPSLVSDSESLSACMEHAAIPATGARPINISLEGLIF